MVALVMSVTGASCRVLGLYLGFVLGAVVGVALIATRRGGRRTASPFGPFMATGTLILVVLHQ